MFLRKAPKNPAEQCQDKALAQPTQYWSHGVLVSSSDTFLLNKTFKVHLRKIHKKPILISTIEETLPLIAIFGKPTLKSGTMEKLQMAKQQRWSINCMRQLWNLESDSKRMIQVKNISTSSSVLIATWKTYYIWTLHVPWPSYTATPQVLFALNSGIFHRHSSHQHNLKSDFQEKNSGEEYFHFKLCTDWYLKNILHLNPPSALTFLHYNPLSPLCSKFRNLPPLLLPINTPCSLSNDWGFTWQVFLLYPSMLMDWA